MKSNELSPRQPPSQNLFSPQESLATIPQTIFGEKTLVEDRQKGFAVDIRTLVTMTITAYNQLCSNDTVTDEPLWTSLKSVWKQL